MKLSNYLLLMFLMGAHTMNAQQIRIEDEAIVAQHKRMVYSKWGDFRPYPKYILWGAIQTNFSYATIWGMWSPRRNKQYKNGSDIRPLRFGGLENRRQFQVYLQEKEAEKIKKSVEEITKNDKKDFAYWTPLTVDADPLWLLYYKKMLNPVKKFPDEPKNFKEWGFLNNDIYRKLQNNGDLKELKKNLDVLKEKYKTSRTVSMPRGKRFLLYHETLLEWRKFISSIKEYNRSNSSGVFYTELMQKIKNGKEQPKYKDDKEIISKILIKHKYVK